MDSFQMRMTIPALVKAAGLKETYEHDILHLSSGKMFGGVERMLLAIAEHGPSFCLTKNHFAVCFDGMLKTKMDDLNVDCEVLGGASFSNPFSVHRVRSELERFLDSKNFKAIFCHGSWTYALFAKIVKNAGISLIHMIHNIQGKLSRYDKWSGRIQPNYVIANSKSSLATANRIHPEVVPTVAYPPCDPLFGKQIILSPNPAQLKEKANGARIILNAARFEEGKGHPLLLKALSKLNPALDWQCWIAGEPQSNQEFRYLALLKKMAKSMKVDHRIRWLGHVDNMAPYYQVADVYFQPNMAPESFGMVFLEATFHKCPVITTKIGGALEVLDPSLPNRLVVQPSVDDFVLSLEQSLDFTRVGAVI